MIHSFMWASGYLPFFSVLVQYLTVFNGCKASACGECIIMSNRFFLASNIFDYRNLVRQNFVFWPSVGPQDIEQQPTYMHASHHPLDDLA